MKKKMCPAQQSFKFPFSNKESCRGIVWGKGNPKNQEQGEELIQPAFCMYLYIQCNKRGTPKNQFTYKTLCRCRMKKKYNKIANEKNRVQ